MKKNKRTRDIRQLIQIDMVIDCGWVHTHGMSKLGLPELEINRVPNFLFEDAARLLNHVADYMVNHAKKRVEVGETMAVSDLCVFRFSPATPRPDDLEHYKDERWELTEVTLPCSDCQAGTCDQHQAGHN